MFLSTPPACSAMKKPSPVAKEGAVVVKFWKLYFFTSSSE